FVPTPKFPSLCIFRFGVVSLVAWNALPLYIITFNPVLTDREVVRIVGEIPFQYAIVADPAQVSVGIADGQIRHIAPMRSHPHMSILFQLRIDVEQLQCM